MDLTPEVAWREGVRQYLELYAALHLAPSSRRRMSIVLAQFGTHLAGMPEVLYLSEITRKHIETYQLARKAAGKSPATVNADIRHLKAFLHRAVIEGWTLSNPARGVKLLRVPKVHAKARTRSDVEAIVTALRRMNKADWADMVLVVVNTGIRLGETLALRTNDVQEGKLHIRVGEGFTPKDREERFVPLNTVAVEAVNRRLLAVGRQVDAFLWPTGTGTQRQATYARTVLKRAAALAKVPRMTWHSLRHTFASATAAFIPEQALMTMCGWSDSRTANRHYIHRNMMNLPPPPTVAGS